MDTQTGYSEKKSDRFDYSHGAIMSDVEIEEEIKIMIENKRRASQCGRLLLVAFYKEDGTVEILVSQNYHSRTYIKS
jgi:hypothetical protein